SSSPHASFSRDWSSAVCSSDLLLKGFSCFSQPVGPLTGPVLWSDTVHPGRVVPARLFPLPGGHVPGRGLGILGGLPVRGLRLATTSLVVSDLVRFALATTSPVVGVSSPRSSHGGVIQGIRLVV